MSEKDQCGGDDKQSPPEGEASQATNTSTASSSVMRAPHYTPQGPPPSYETHNKRKELQHPGKPESQAAAFAHGAPAATVFGVMGPPPGPEEGEKKHFWRRWFMDRQEANEVKLPARDSSNRWNVRGAKVDWRWS